MSCFSRNAENMNRKEKLAMIRYLYKTQGMSAAQKFWLGECARISKKAFMEQLQ